MHGHKMPMLRRLAVRLEWFEQTAAALREGRLAPETTQVSVAQWDVPLSGVTIPRGTVLVRDASGVRRGTSQRAPLAGPTDGDFELREHDFEMVEQPDWNLRAVRAAVLMPAAEAASCTRFPHTLDAAQVVELGADAGDCECVYVLASPKMPFRELASTLGAVAETCAGGKPIAFYVDMVCGPLLPGDGELEPLVPDSGVAALCSQRAILPGKWACRGNLNELEFRCELLQLTNLDSLSSDPAPMLIFVGRRQVLDQSTYIADISDHAEGLALMFSTHSAMRAAPRPYSILPEAAPELRSMTALLASSNGIGKQHRLFAICVASTVVAKMRYDVCLTTGDMDDAALLEEFARPLCNLASAHAALSSHGDACAVLVRVLDGMRGAHVVSEDFFYQVAFSMRLVRPGPYELFQDSGEDSDAVAAAWRSTTEAARRLVGDMLALRANSSGLVAAQSCIQVVAAMRDWSLLQTVAERVRVLSRFAPDQRARGDARNVAEAGAAAASLLARTHNARMMPEMNKRGMANISSSTTLSCWCETALLLVEASAMNRQFGVAGSLASSACDAMDLHFPARRDEFCARACAAIVVPYETHRRQLDEPAFYIQSLCDRGRASLERLGRDASRLGVTVRRYLLYGVADAAMSGTVSREVVLQAADLVLLDAGGMLGYPSWDLDVALVWHAGADAYLALGCAQEARSLASHALRMYQAIGDRAGPTDGAVLALLGATWLREAPSHAAALLQKGLSLMPESSTIDRATALLRLADSCELRGMHRRARALRASVVQGFKARDGAASPIAQWLCAVYNTHTERSPEQRVKDVASVRAELMKWAESEPTLELREAMRCITAIVRGAAVDLHLLS